jgi:hypothetical protein
LHSPSNSSVSLLRSPVNISKLRATVQVKEEPPVPCLTSEESFPSSQQFPAGTKAPPLSATPGGRVCREGPQVPSPATFLSKADKESACAPHPRSQHRWAPSPLALLPFPSLRTPRAPWSSANHAGGVAPRGRPHSVSSAKGGPEGGWAGTVGRPRVGTALDFM